VPQAMENRLKQSRFIEQAMVIGEGEKFPAVFVVPNFSFVREWAERHQLDFSKLSNNEVIINEQLVARIQKEITEINTEYGSWEQLKKVKLLPQEFTIEGGELTPTLKFKRKKILEKYQTQYHEIFSA
jgi:long-chain acyl-CoA synthetase